MKKKIRIIALSILLLCLGQTIFAQEKSDETKDFERLQSRSLELQREKSHRKRTDSETYQDGGSKLKEKSVTIYEFIPPDRSYYLINTESGSEKSKTEYIRIGKDEFARKNSGKWEIYKSESIYGIGTSSQPTVKFRGTEKLGNKTASIYEVKENSYFSLSGSRDETTIYWFDENGYLLKEVTQAKSTDEDLTFTIVKTYDYDAKIKIEAPKIKKIKK